MNKTDTQGYISSENYGLKGGGGIKCGYWERIKLKQLRENYFLALYISEDRLLIPMA